MAKPFTGNDTVLSVVACGQAAHAARSRAVPSAPRTISTEALNAYEAGFKTGWREAVAWLGLQGYLTKEQSQ